MNPLLITLITTITVLTLTTPSSVYGKRKILRQTPNADERMHERQDSGSPFEKTLVLGGDGKPIKWIGKNRDRRAKGASSTGDSVGEILLDPTSEEVGRVFFGAKKEIIKAIEHVFAGDTIVVDPDKLAIGKESRKVEIAAGDNKYFEYHFRLVLGEIFVGELLISAIPNGDITDYVVRVSKLTKQ